MARIHHDHGIQKILGGVQWTCHGQRRQNERGIPPFIVDALIDFGDERSAGNGCRSYSFTRAQWKRFAHYMGKAISGFEKYRNAYLVVAEDGAVITVAWKH